jgi:hypothetical protein
MKDQHHYKTTSHARGLLSDYKAKDAVKQLQAEKQGITLIIVPFWWDRNPQR